MAMKVEDKQVNKASQVYRRLLGYLKPHRGRFALALFFMVLYGCTDGVIPFLIRSILDDIFGKQNKQMLYMLPIILICFGVARGLIGFFEKYLASSVGLAIIKDIRNEINSHLLTLSASFYSRHSSGSLISRMTNDTLLVRSALTDAVAAVLRDTVRMIALFCAAAYLDPMLAAVAFLGFPLGIYPVIRYGKKVRRLSKVGQDQFGGLTSILQESILGQKVVQAFGLEKYEQERFNAENKKLTSTYLKAEKYGALGAPTNELIATVAIAGIILYGGYTVISGVRTQGDFIAFITALFLCYDPLKKITRVNNIIQMGNAAAERIFEILDTKPEIFDEEDAIDEVIKSPVVEYKNVSFAYPQNGEVTSDNHQAVVLNSISFSVNPGQTLALVGMSGGGKSTIVNLLPRFYDVSAGAISINGLDIRKRTLVSLRRAIAIVSQHTFLFDDTIYNNILYGRVEATSDEVIAAAKAANAYNFISALPKTFQTRIGEQGLRLSGGERARIAIARALLKNAPILILDEATAALDSESEQLVQEAIERLMQGRTVFVIAHRLATVRNADQIAVVVNGRIIEQGNHKDLLAKNGEYTKLYEIQFSENTGNGQ
ncbi:MAG: ATP-binding cassette domain-containing protein [Deltaproteobacteria bacterium]|nr:ATP-binding cassette domain-containing protein [Deltaproteobacteria bacterium]